MIPKANKSMRPLGIPTMFDRSVQALYNLVLLPIAEATADSDQYDGCGKRLCLSTEK